MTSSDHRDAPSFEAFLEMLLASLAKRRDAMSLVREYENPAGDRATRRRLGRFYTPDPLVNTITSEALARHAARSSRLPRVIDPACGAGALLLTAFRRLVSDESSVEARIDTLRSSIFGIDADTGAIEAARRVLALAVLERTSVDAARRWLAKGGHAAKLFEAVQCRLRWGDAIFRCGHTPMGAPPVCWRDAFDVSLARGGCDIVLANPPFHSYSGREAARLSQAAVRSLRERFGDEDRWLTAHGCFLRMIVDELAPRVVGIVLPEQVAHLAGYSAIRKAVASATGIVEVRRHGEAVFERAATPVITVIADRTHRGPARVLDAHGQLIGTTPPRRTLAEGGAPWMPAMPESLRAKLYADTMSLAGLVADPGVHTGNAAAMLLADTPRKNGRWERVLQGRDVDRYRCSEPAMWLRTDAPTTNRAYFRIAKRERYTDAAFVIRQTAACPIVGPRRHADYFRNSLLALYPPADDTDVRYLVGVLNSRLMRLVYRALIGESRQRTFPQVKVSSLRALPIKRIEGDKARASHDRIVTLVSRMLESPNADVDREIDREIGRLYGLSESEWKALTELAGQPINP